MTILKFPTGSYPTVNGVGFFDIGTIPVADAAANIIVGSDYLATALWGRVTTLELADATVASVEVLTPPAYGNVTVNPDNTLSLVLSGETSEADVSFGIRITHDNASTSDETIVATLDLDKRQNGGWGAGNGYMLQLDANDRVVVEHGENHRKVYVTGDPAALSIADIAALEGVPVGDVDGDFLVAHPEYGATEGMALAEDAGDALWLQMLINGRHSSWMLIERGYEYHVLWPVRISLRGETELHPAFIGAYGTGAKPKMFMETRLIKSGGHRFVVQDLDFESMFRAQSGSNILLDHVILRNHEVDIQYINGFTLRKSAILDCQDEEATGTTWWAHADRESALFLSDCDGVLFQNNLLDLNGFGLGYDYDSSAEFPQPPTLYSHNYYMASDNKDITVEGNIIMRGASTGAQFRSGGMMRDTIFIDNNLGMNIGFGQDDIIDGNYTVVDNVVITSAGHRDSSYNEGALSGGIDVIGFKSTIVDLIVAHLADPNNASELAAKPHTDKAMTQWNGHTKSWPQPAFKSSKVYNWVGANKYDEFDDVNENVEGLSETVLNATTVQIYAAQELGQPTATIAEYAAFLRADYEGAVIETDARDILGFFQSAFGNVGAVRTTAQELRFIPSNIADGIRWDTRLNWDTQDLPGTVAGDSVHLGGNWVNYGGTTSVDDLTFGSGGQLRVLHGYLNVDGDLVLDGEASVTTQSAGQFWVNGYAGTDKLNINASGGRFANTGTFTGAVDLNVSGSAEVLLAAQAAAFTLPSGSSMSITGGKAKVGFDGNAGGACSAVFAAGSTLAFFADDTGIGTIREFFSGHYGATDIASTVSLAGALDIDVTALSGTLATHKLIDVDTVTGAFSDVTVTGLGVERDLTITVGASTVTVDVTTGGTGQITQLVS